MSADDPQWATEEGGIMIFSMFMAAIVCYPILHLLSKFIFDEKDQGDYPGWYILICITIYVFVLAGINWAMLL